MPPPDTITSDPPAGQNGATPTPIASPRREYVAAGGLGIYYRQGIHTLPWDIDDLTQELGDDIYDRMMVDPQVAKSVNIIKTAIIEDSVQIINALGDPDADGYEQGADYVAFCASVLDDLETPLDDVVWNLLDAIYLGNKLGEQVYALDSTYTGRQQLVLRAIKVKPRTTTAFVVDQFLNVVGIQARRADQPTLVALQDRRNLLPREKFVIMSFRPKDGDPRGTSILRPAYNAWWIKMQLWGEFLKYMTQFGSPSIVGMTAENALDQPDPDNPETDISPEASMLKQLLAFRNGTAIAIPHSADVKLIFSQGDGRAFYSAFTMLDQQIGNGIVHQSLATEEGEHQARAAAQVHQDVLDQIIRQMKKAIATLLRRHILRPLIRYNYGEQALKLTPRVNLGDVEHQDWTDAANALSQLWAAGYLVPDQQPALDRMVGLPERKELSVVAVPRPNERPADSSTPPPNQTQPAAQPQSGGAQP